MNLLAVETSGRSGSIALVTADGQTQQRELSSEGRRHAQTLVSDADELVSEHGLSPRDIQCVAVSMGPGSFTGLRVGIVFAKTFGWLNKCPVVAVSTFEAIAWQARDLSQRIVVIGDAQRGELFCGVFQAKEGRVTPESPVRISQPEQVARAVRSTDCVTGPGLDKHRDMFSASATIAPEAVWTPQASSVASLGTVSFSMGDIADPWKLEPFYLRRSAAEEKRDAAAAETGENA